MKFHDRLGAGRQRVCPFIPDAFSAVGLWYEHFEQTSDDEVRQLLDVRAGASKSPATAK